MEVELRTLIKTKTDNVFWGVAPREAPLPRVTLQQISEPSQNTFDGRITELRSTVIQLDIWGTDYNQVHQIYKNLIPLDGHMGATSDALKFVIFGQKRTSIDASTSEVIHRIMIELTVWFSEIV